MGFWEKGYFSSAIIILLTACAYAAFVAQQSIESGTLAAPEFSSFLIAMLTCITVSIISVLVISEIEKRQARGGQGVQELDERDLLVGLYAKSGTIHVLSIGIYVSLAAFFIHRNGIILFYSTFAATLLADITRCVLQPSCYNRPI